MSKFCENCKQDVEPRTPLGAIVRYVLMFIFLPLVTSIMVEITSYEIDWAVGAWFGILVAIMGIAYRIIFEKDKKCPMCNDKRFRKKED